MYLNTHTRVGLLCLLVFLVSTAAHAQGSTSEAFPRLLKPLEHSEVTISSVELPPDVDVVTAAGRPVVQLASLDTSLLKTNPAGLTLDMPGLSSGLKVSLRPEIQVNANFDQQFADISSNGNTFQQRFPKVWVGTVAGARPGFSAVVFTHDEENDVVHGSVRFWDRKTKRIRVFRIAPVAKQGGVTTPAASAGGDSAANAQAASPAPYMTVEFKEPLVLDSHPTYVEEPQGEVTPAAAAADTGIEAMSAAAAEIKPAVGTDGVAFLPMLQLLAPEAPAAPDVAAASSAGSRTAPAVQDALVVYTAKAAANEGGNATLLSLVQQNFARANLAYKDSGLALQLTLLAFRLWSFNEANRGNKEIVEIARTDAAVAKLRNDVGADIVIVFDGDRYAIGGGLICGLAYVGGTADFAFANIHAGCLNVGYAMAHEVGHIQGCGHSVDQNEANTVGLQGPYARGWRRCDITNSFNTVMAYQCGRSASLGLFANPSLKYLGVPAGDAKNGHCARALSETASKIANFRVRKGVPPPVPSPTPGRSPTPGLSPPPSTPAKTTWLNTTGCDDTAAVLACPAGTTIGLVAIRFGRWNMAAGVCGLPTPPAGSPHRSKVYFANLSDGFYNKFTVAAGLVRIVGEDPYPGASFTRQYEITYACNTKYVLYLGAVQSCGAISVSCSPLTLHTSTLVMVGRWNNTVCPGAGVNAKTHPWAKVYPLNIPANVKNSASLPATVVSPQPDDVYRNVQKQVAWAYGCVLGS